MDYSKPNVSLSWGHSSVGRHLLRGQARPTRPMVSKYLCLPIIFLKMIFEVCLYCSHFLMNCANILPRKTLFRGIKTRSCSSLRQPRNVRDSPRGGREGETQRSTAFYTLLRLQPCPPLSRPLPSPVHSPNKLKSNATFIKGQQQSRRRRRCHLQNKGTPFSIASDSSCYSIL